jgi:hypothetical protein
MKKPLALLLCLLLATILRANMASPVKSGSATGLPYISTYVRVLHETLKITPAADFKTCKFQVIYDIFADTSGISIPMLFVAEGYDGGMKVWVDGMSVPVSSLVDGVQIQQVSPLSQFIMDEPSGNEAVVDWGERKERYAFRDLVYFIFDLSKGGHQVRVEYSAVPWEDRSDWVRVDKFQYALSPARNWQSFGKLDVILDARAITTDSLATNLGKPHSGDLRTEAAWQFDQLPESPTLEVIRVPAISGTAKALISFGMDGFLWTSGILFALLHLYFIFLWRKGHHQHWFSWVWLLGTFAVPFLAMVVFLFSESWINGAIGDVASRRPNYNFLIMILYPLALLVYGFITRVIDHFIREAQRSRSTTA